MNNWKLYLVGKVCAGTRATYYCAESLIPWKTQASLSTQVESINLQWRQRVHDTKGCIFSTQISHSLAPSQWPARCDKLFRGPRDVPRKTCIFSFNYLPEISAKHLTARRASLSIGWNFKDTPFPNGCGMQMGDYFSYLLLQWRDNWKILTAQNVHF